MKTSLLPILAIPLLLSACGGGNPTTPINLPVVATGTVLGVELGASQSFDGTTYTTTPTEVQTSDRSTAAGLALTVSSTADPAGSTTASLREARIDTLTDVSVASAMTRGASFNDVAGLSGSTHFKNGSFGDVTAQGDARTQIAGVSIRFPDAAGEISLSKVALINVNSFDSGTNEGVFGVGFVGSATPVGSVPVAGVGTYRAFLQSGQAIYNSAGNTRTLAIQDRATGVAPVFDIVADFNAGTVGVDINNINLVGADATNTNSAIILNPTVEGFIMSGAIAGNTITGTQIQLVDSADNLVGVIIDGQVAGGFFGSTAQEVALAGVLEGAMSIDDGTGFAVREYVLSLTAGGAQ